MLMLITCFFLKH